MFGHNIKNEFYLDDSIVFLNHGSFGAVPKIVMNSHFNWLKYIEKEPVKFFVEEHEQHINNVLKHLAGFINSEVDSLVFIDNATTAINTILYSLSDLLNQNDEIIFTNHIYSSVYSTIKNIEKTKHIILNNLSIPFPIESSNQILEVFENNIKSNTRIAVIDHISSATAMIFPIKEINEICKKNNIILIVDAAHAPGMIDIDLQDLDVDFYTGNCHKWMFAPKGVAFIYSSKKYHNILKPMVISLNHGCGYQKEFLYQGTRSPAKFLALIDSINYINKYGKENIINYNHELAINARNMINEKFGFSIQTPDEMIANMASFELSKLKIHSHEDAMNLRYIFLKKYKIEIPFFCHDNKALIRLSAQIYNDISDIERLINALDDFLNNQI